MDTWERLFQERSWGRWPSEALVRTVARLSNTAGRPLDVLEIGCGPAANLWYLAHEGHNASGIDLSPTAVAQAKDRLATEGQTADVRVADATALPFADNTFDLAIDIEAIYCLPEKVGDAAWSEAARVIKPGGYVYSIAFTDDVTGLDSGTRLSDRTVTDLKKGPLANLGVVTYSNEDHVRERARSAGLEMVEVQRVSRTVGPDHDVIFEITVLAQKPLN